MGVTSPCALNNRMTTHALRELTKELTYDTLTVLKMAILASSNIIQQNDDILDIWNFRRAIFRVMPSRLGALTVRSSS
jgi:hypothetical protein